MKKLVGILLALVYLGSFSLHKLVHASESQASACAVCATGNAQCVAAGAPVIGAPNWIESEAAIFFIPGGLPGAIFSLPARGPPAV